MLFEKAEELTKKTRCADEEVIVLALEAFRTISEEKKI